MNVAGISRRKGPVYRRLAIGAVVIVALGVGVAVTLHLRGTTPASNPFIGTRQELQQLASTTASLQKVAQKPGGTKAYLAGMNNMVSECRRVQSYYDTWRNGQRAEADAALMNQAQQLCTDTARLAAYSSAVFTPLQPLLDARAKPLRYQTLWPFAGRMRAGQTQAVEAAIQQEQDLQDQQRADSDAVDFSSDALPELRTLQTAMKQSQGLNYLPALRTFQGRMTGERQRFWEEYAGLSDLQQTLEHLLSNM